LNRPGRIELPAGKSMDLIEAIAASGGLTRAADRKRIKVRRDNAVQNLDWDDAMKNRFELRPDEVGRSARESTDLGAGPKTPVVD